jgi:hypothetical protein
VFTLVLIITLQSSVEYHLSLSLTSCSLESMCGPQCTFLMQTLESNYEDGKFNELSQGIGDYVYLFLDVRMYVCMYV